MFHLELLSPTVILAAIIAPLLLFAILTLFDHRLPIDRRERRRRTGRRIPRLALFATLMAYVTMSLLHVLSTGLSDLGSQLILGPILALTGFLAYLMVPGLTGLVMSVGPAFRWKAPARILVLRRFHRGESSRSLRRFLTRSVAPYGHVYTLADRDIRTRWYVRFPVVLTQLAFLHFRTRVVRNERGVSALVRMMNQRWARNLNWFLSWEKTFAIRSTDAAWRNLVRALSSQADAVLIDLSDPSENLAWEIQHLVDGGCASRMVILTDQRHRALAEEAIRQWPEAGLKERLAVYDREPDRAVELVAEAIGGQEATFGPVWKSQPLRGHALAAAKMLGPFGVAAFLLSWTLFSPALELYFTESGSVRRHIILLEHSTRGRADSLRWLSRWAPGEVESTGARRLAPPHNLSSALERAWREAPELRPEIASMLRYFETAWPGDLAWLVLQELPDEYLGIKRIAAGDLQEQPFASSKARNILLLRARSFDPALQDPQVDSLLSSLLGASDYWYVQEDLLGDPQTRDQALRGLARRVEVGEVPALGTHGSSIVAALDDVWNDAPALREEVDLVLVGLPEPSRYWDPQLERLGDAGEREEALSRLRRWADLGAVPGDTFARRRVTTALRGLWNEVPALGPEIAPFLEHFSEQGLAWLVLRELPDDERASKQRAVDLLSSDRFALDHLVEHTLARLQRGTSNGDRAAAREVDLMLVRGLANANGGFFLARRLDELADAADDPEVRRAALAAAESVRERYR